MNEDRIVGAGRELLGKGERKLGDVTGSESLQGDGVVDQVAGAVQHGYGKVRDVISEVVDDAPGTVAGVIDRGRELGRKGDEAIRDRMGDNGPLYLIGGAIALFAIGAFVLARSSAATGPEPKMRRVAAKRTSTTARSDG